MSDIDINGMILGLVANVSTIAGLRGYTRLPGTITPPGAVFEVRGIEYDVAMDRGADDVLFRAIVFTSSASQNNIDTLYGYMLAEGDTSVKQALESDETLGCGASYVVVESTNAPGLATIGGVQMYAVDFEGRVGF